MAMQSQDIIKRSATNNITPPPQARNYRAEVAAKLIDVTTCIGCKGCQVHAQSGTIFVMKWVTATESMTTRQICSAKSWTVMRFSETTQNDKLGMADPQRRLHALRRSWLFESLSITWVTIIQYANGIVDFQSEHCIGCGYCIAGCPFNIPRLNPEDNRVYKCTLCVDRVSVGQEPGLRENLSDRCYPVWNQKRDA